MRGTRRDPRFALLVPWKGSVRVPADVIVERYSGNDVWVLSATPARVDEVLTLELVGTGPPVTVKVKVVESSPVLTDGVMRHGLRLAIVP